MHRVVVTGMGGYSPVGNSWEEIEATLRAGKNRIQHMAAWDIYDGLNTRLGGPVQNFEKPPHFTRKKTRSMGRVSLMATAASEDALRDAGLLEDEILGSGRVGVAYGSSSGSTDAIRSAGVSSENGTTQSTAARPASPSIRSSSAFTGRDSPFRRRTESSSLTATTSRSPRLLASSR